MQRLLNSIAYLFFLFMVFQSCAVIDKNGFSNKSILDEKSLHKIDGYYKNYPDSSFGQMKDLLDGRTFKPKPFWYQINDFRLFHDTNRLKKQTIELKTISKKKIRFLLHEGDTVIQAKTIRGKLKDGFFYRRPFFVFSPLFPLVFGYRTYRYRIGYLDDTIFIDYKWNVWAFALAAGDFSKGNSHSKFKKLTFN